MGRPKKSKEEKLHVVGTALPEAALARLDQYARDLAEEQKAPAKTRSALVREIVEAALDDFDRRGPRKRPKRRDADGAEATQTHLPFAADGQKPAAVSDGRLVAKQEAQDTWWSRAIGPIVVSICLGVSGSAQARNGDGEIRTLDTGTSARRRSSERNNSLPVNSREPKRIAA